MAEPDDHLEALDAVYFRAVSWPERLEQWLKERSRTPFTASHVAAIDLSVQTESTSLRMCVNMGAQTLLEFLARGAYMNGYERKRVLGGKSPGAMRQRVDAALGIPPDRIYFGAVVLNGTGVRFYGAYGAVLRPDRIDPETQVMDRNSWMIEFPPLKDAAPDGEQSDEARGLVVERLRGSWHQDLLPMVKLKVLPSLGEPVRLPTTGTISEEILHDESYIEVHRVTTFAPADLQEIREVPQDAAIEADIAERERRGLPVADEERIWARRRRVVSDRLHRRGVRRRIVATSGRERG